MKNVIVILALCLMSCSKGQDIECYSIGYMDSVINYYEGLIDNYYPDTVFVQIEDSLVGLYQDSLQTCRDLLILDGTDIIANTYSFSITDSSMQKVNVFVDNGYVGVKLTKGFSKIEFMLDSIIYFGCGSMQDSVFVRDFIFEKSIIWPEKSDTMLIW